MKKCYVHLKRLPEREIRKFFGKADVKNEIKIEYHDDINDQIYSDNVSQFIFLFLDIWDFRMKIMSINFENILM